MQTGAMPLPHVYTHAWLKNLYKQREVWLLIPPLPGLQGRDTQGPSSESACPV